MGATPTEYDAVIADLEAQVIELQSAIEILRRQRDKDAGSPGGAPTSLSSGPPQATTKAPIGPTRTPVLPSDAFFGMSLVDAARKYMALVRRPVPTKEMMEVLERGGFQTSSKKFYGTVFGVLSRRLHDEGDIVKAGGAWALAEWYPNLRRKAKRDEGEEPGSATRRPAEAAEAEG